MISLGKHHDDLDQELSYQLLPKFWGMGLAFETLTAILDFTSESLEYKTIIAETQAANDASRRLLEKLGMSIDKTISRFGEEQIIYRKALQKLKRLDG